MRVAALLAEGPPSFRWHFSSIYGRIVYRLAFAEFGKKSVIVAPLRLRGTVRIRIGNGCAIYEGSWLEAEPEAHLTIADNVYLGHDVHLHAVDNVTIGRGTMITDGVLISSGAHDRSNSWAATGTGEISIGQECFIGQRAIILGGVSVGDRATIAAGAVATGDVAAGQTVAGVLARPVVSSSGPAQDVNFLEADPA